KFAEEDKKRKEKVENRNKLDGMIFSVEQTMKEAGDKLDENDKSTLQAAVDAAKKELESDDDDRIKAAYDKLMQDVQPVFTKMYQAAGGANGGEAPAGDGDTEFHQ
ncbi:MAG: Hsp70 family protein, partial [Clostridia bacterium]|nr:Hsp70 family protein [Clostridia bacterium]